MDLCALPVRRGQEGRTGPAGTVHGDDGRWCRGVRCAQARRERSDPVPAGPASPAGHLPAAAHPHGERGGAGPPPREDSSTPGGRGGPVSTPEHDAAPLPCSTCGRTRPDSAWRTAWPNCPACAAPQFTGNQAPDPLPGSPPPVDPYGRGPVGSVLYEVRGDWPVAHVVRFAQEVALCGRPMPDRFVALRSSTFPVGTDLCPGCRALRAGGGRRTNRARRPGHGVQEGSVTSHPVNVARLWCGGP